MPRTPIPISILDATWFLLESSPYLNCSHTLAFLGLNNVAANVDIEPAIILATSSRWTSCPFIILPSSVILTVWRVPSPLVSNPINAVTKLEIGSNILFIALIAIIAWTISLREIFLKSSPINFVNSLTVPVIVLAEAIISTGSPVISLPFMNLAGLIFPSSVEIAAILPRASAITATCVIIIVNAEPLAITLTMPEPKNPPNDTPLIMSINPWHAFFIVDIIDCIDASLRLDSSIFMRNPTILSRSLIVSPANKITGAKEVAPNSIIGKNKPATPAKAPNSETSFSIIEILLTALTPQSSPKVSIAYDVNAATPANTIKDVAANPCAAINASEPEIITAESIPATPAKAPNARTRVVIAPIAINVSLHSSSLFFLITRIPIIPINTAVDAAINPVIRSIAADPDTICILKVDANNARAAPSNTIAVNNPNASQTLPEPTSFIPAPANTIPSATTPHTAINAFISNIDVAAFLKLATLLIVLTSIASAAPSNTIPVNNPTASQMLPEPTCLIPSPTRTISAATPPHKSMNLVISIIAAAAFSIVLPLVTVCASIATLIVPYMTPAIKTKPSAVSASWFFKNQPSKIVPAAIPRQAVSNFAILKSAFVLVRTSNLAASVNIPIVINP